MVLDITQYNMISMLLVITQVKRTYQHGVCVATVLLTHNSKI